MKIPVRRLVLTGIYYSVTRIIHKNNPHFNRRKFQFEFQNGEVLRLKLYEHLRVG